jgi:hypothetical protein
VPIFKKRPVTLTALLLSAGIIAVTPMGVSAASSGGAHVRLHPGPGVPSAELATESSLGPIPDELEHIGVTSLSHVYGGLVVTDDRTHVDVYLTKLTPATEAQFLAAAPRGTLTFHRTSHTRIELLAVHKLVTRAAAGLAARGIQLVSWFPGVNGDTLEHIGVLNLTRARARVLKGLFGAGNVVLQNVLPGDAPRTTGRDSDSSPWNGGDNLSSHGTGCTSGAGINYNGNQYMLTAAHCYEPGWDIYNAFAGDSGPEMGTEYSRDVSDGGDDTALISMSTSDLIWAGGYDKPVRQIDYGSATNPDGDTVCNEGSYSGEVCSTVVSENYGCIWVGPIVGLSGSRYECNLDEAQAVGTTTDIATEDGDSGAPMIRYLNGELNVTGIVSAGSSPVACQFNVGSTCYQVVYYTSMREILATEYAGATLVTG